MNILIILALLLPRSEAAQESDEGEARRLLWGLGVPGSQISAPVRYHSCSRDPYRECPRVGRPLNMILPVDLSMRAECMNEK